MTRFEELCDSYRKLLTEAEEYESDCKNFAKTIVNGFIDFLECGRNDLIIKDFSLNEDGYYHAILQLTVYDSPEPHAEKGLVPDILLKIGYDKGDFIIRTSTGNQVFAIRREELEKTDSESLVNLYEYLFRGIKSYYETPADEFVHRNMQGLINFG